MADRDEHYQRKARDEVQNDEGTIASVSTTLCRALGLDATNRTLGRKVVRYAAVAEGSFDLFKDKVAELVSVKSDFLEDIFRVVEAKVASLKNALQSAEFDDDDDGGGGGGGGGGISGFASRPERLEGGGMEGMRGRGRRPCPLRRRRRRRRRRMRRRMRRMRRMRRRGRVGRLLGGCGRVGGGGLGSVA